MDLHHEEGSLGDLLMQQLKRMAFRWPGIREATRPRYSYNIEPAQLSWLCSAIETTKSARASSALEESCIVEVGVARGMTTTFLLQHMKQIGDQRKYFCIDTFAGFVNTDVDYEVRFRNKSRSHFRGFRYNNKDIFEQNLLKSGFDNFVAIQADANTFYWHTIAKIDVMLLDVDLYRPTKYVLHNSFDRWSRPAYVMVDDVGPAGDYDGASQAYLEFCSEKGLGVARVGNKAGVIVLSGMT